MLRDMPKARDGQCRAGAYLVDPRIQNYLLGEADAFVFSLRGDA